MIGTAHFDGMKDFIFCSSDVNEENKYDDYDSLLFVIDDPKITAKQLEFKIVQKRESIYLIHKQFDYEYSNGVFMALLPEEEYPLQSGTVFQMGTKTQFIIERFNTGLIAAPGKRTNMEDTFVINHDLKLHPQLPISIYSVIDGHGGDWCAVYLRQRLENEIRKNLLDPQLGIYGNQRKGLNEIVSIALKKSFSYLDEQYKDYCHSQQYKQQINQMYLDNQHQFSNKANNCGSTAVLVLIIGAHIFCANVGDSRAVLCRNGKAYNLSYDHKASRQDEVERIKEKGGIVEYGRVGNKLAITRSFGDFQFKSKTNEKGEKIRNDMITSEPEIRYTNYDPKDDDFILLASDGLFDIFTSQKAVDFIREKMLGMKYMAQDVDIISRQIAYEAIYKNFSRDNTTVMIVALNRGAKELKI